MKLNVCIVLAITLFYLACKSEKPNPSPKPSPKPYTSSLDSLIKKGGGPCEKEGDCMTVKAYWPVITGGEKKVSAPLNDSIQKWVVTYLDYGMTNRNIPISSAVDSLLQLYQNAYEKEENFGMNWAAEVKSNIKFQDTLALFEINQYSFMGGAHGNYSTNYINLNLQNGEVIEYESFVQDTTSFKMTIQQKLESHIEQTYKEYDLSIDDLFWGSGFTLPFNFSLEKDSIGLLYNPYEAAPYAVGTIDFKVAYSDLGKSIKF